MQNCIDSSCSICEVNDVGCRCSNEVCKPLLCYLDAIEALLAGHASGAEPSGSKKSPRIGRGRQSARQTRLFGFLGDLCLTSIESKSEDASKILFTSEELQSADFAFQFLHLD